MIWLAGGPSTIDMWDLKTDASARVRGEFNPISTSAGSIQICEHLPMIAKQMHECTLVRSVSHTYIKYNDGTEELYDLNEDPNEWNNLASLDKYSELKEKMASYIPNYIAPTSYRPWETCKQLKNLPVGRDIFSRAVRRAYWTICPVGPLDF